MSRTTSPGRTAVGLLVVVIVAVASLRSAEPAGAARGSGGDAVEVGRSASGNPVVAVYRDGGIEVPAGPSRRVPSGRAGRAGSARSCAVTEALDDPVLEGAPLGTLGFGRWYWARCVGADGVETLVRRFRYVAGAPVVSGRRLARASRAELEVAYPLPRTNPAIEAPQLVGVPTWLWVDAQGWEPAAATASLPGISATVEAVPTVVEWDPGDGTEPFRCPGPGTAYDPSRTAAGQRSRCTHTYVDAGRFTATVTVRWTVSWSATDGTSGSMGAVERSTRFVVGVAEFQAVGV